MRILLIQWQIMLRGWWPQIGIATSNLSQIFVLHDAFFVIAGLDLCLGEWRHQIEVKFSFGNATPNSGQVQNITNHLPIRRRWKQHHSSTHRKHLHLWQHLQFFFSHILSQNFSCWQRRKLKFLQKENITPVQVKTKLFPDWQPKLTPAREAIQTKTHDRNWKVKRIYLREGQCWRLSHPGAWLYTPCILSWVCGDDHHVYFSAPLDHFFFDSKIW